MLLDEQMRRAGERLFRWRSFALLGFLPLVALAVHAGEPIERAVGAFWGDLFEAACVALVLVGLALRAATVGFVPSKTSGRNTQGQVARSLNITGLYALTRNPLYLANCAIYLGVVLYTQDLMLALAVALFLAVYYERIILAEEAFLAARFGDDYRAWAAEVPVFLPRRRGWRAPALAFSFRTVLRREYPTWLGAAVALTVIGQAADWSGGDPDEPWRLIASLAVAGYLALHVLNRRSRLLRVPGR